MKNNKLKSTILLTVTTLMLASCGKDDTADTTTTQPVVPSEPQITMLDSEFIGMPKAEELALEHAKTTVADISNLTSNMDLSDENEVKYIVDFTLLETDYHYTIHAKTGEVLDFLLSNENASVDDIEEISDYIGQDKAKEIAYDDAGVFSDDVDFVHVKLEVVDDVTTYDVEFYIGAIEYDYQIDAITGTILDFDNDAELFDVSIPEELILGEAIGEEQAVNIATEDADVDSTSNLFVKLETNADLSSHYWVEFLAGNTQYGYEIQSVTGEILFKTSESDENAVDGVIVDQNDVESPYIGEGKAVSTAVNHAGADPTSEITVELVVDDVKSRYNIGFSINNSVYAYEIDAINGKIFVADKVTSNYNDGANVSTTSTDSTSSSSVIGDEAALDIALNFVNADTATFIKVDFSHENGTPVYLINFRIDGTIYDFEIDAITGRILDYIKS